ncbi:hypothetical protein EBT16_04215 [bacterium]|nr:hypothetical protein [bacterium]
MDTFRQWLESRDIFGFEGKRDERPREVDEDPIVPMNAEVIIETMLGTDIEGRKAFSDYPDQVQWGREPGAMQMVISPLGSFKSIVRKLQVNLKGENVWVCKKIMPYKDIMHSNVRFDEAFAMALFEQIEKISHGEMEAPARDYGGLESLTLKVANRCVKKDVLPEVFIFRGVREIKKNENYLIFFEPRGQGVEAPGSARVEQFMIDMSYDGKTGMVRSFGHDIQSPTRGHVWYPQPSEWDEYFSPTQDKNEIVDAVSSAFRTY